MIYVPWTLAAYTYMLGYDKYLKNNFYADLHK
jgi:hypothetical protein